MKIEKIKRTYKGTYINGYLNKHYLFCENEKIIIADTFVNAKNKKSAVNKIARRLGLHTYDEEELENDVEFGYVTVEEANYYDEETNETYKWYVSFKYTN